SKTELSLMVFCPSCGTKFKHELTYLGRSGGAISGAIAGAMMGAKTGIVAGPLGAIAGTVPGAILGVIFGKNAGNSFDKPVCPKCKTKFVLPDNLRVR